MKKLSPSQKEKTKKKSTLRHVIFKFLKKKFLKREKECHLGLANMYRSIEIENPGIKMRRNSES